VLTATASVTDPICPGSTSTIQFSGTPSSVVTYDLGGPDYTVTLNAEGTATVASPQLYVNSTLTLTLVELAGQCVKPIEYSTSIEVLC
jgi:hypothetical protein